jgi:hypothetical protein
MCGYAEKFHVLTIELVPDMETGCCLDPGENGTGSEGGGEAGPNSPERGKDKQLKPREGGENMRKEEEEHIRT